MVDVSIIFVNYNSASLAEEAIKSVKEKSSLFTYEIIIVDNSNSGQEIKNLHDRLDKYDAKIIDAKDNLGFGKANNLGAKSATGKYVYFLNTDTILINNAIYELYSFLENHPSVGLVGSNLYTKDEKPNHSYIKPEKNLKYEKKMNSFGFSIYAKFHKDRTDFNYTDEPLKLDGYVCGASYMMLKEDFDKLGGFDKDIFMYAEESLLAFRLKNELHKEIYNVPSSKIIHLEGGTMEGQNDRRLGLIVDGNYIYYIKAFGKDVALKYLKFFKNIYAKKANIAKILFKKEKAAIFKMSSEVYKRKYLEELNK